MLFGHQDAVRNRDELTSGFGARLSEARGDGGVDRNTLFAAGKVVGGRRLLLGTGSDLVANPGPDRISQRPADRVAQEDSVRIVWTGPGEATAAFVGAPVDLTREANGAVAVIADVQVDAAPSGPVTLNGATVTDRLRQLAGRWGQVAVPLACLGAGNLAHVKRPFTITTSGRLDMTISRARLGSAQDGLIKCE